MEYWASPVTDEIVRISPLSTGDFGRERLTNDRGDFNADRARNPQTRRHSVAMDEANYAHARIILKTLRTRHGQGDSRALGSGRKIFKQRPS